MENRGVPGVSIAVMVALGVGAVALLFLKGGGGNETPTGFVRSPTPYKGRLWTDDEVKLSNDLTRLEERGNIALERNP